MVCAQRRAAQGTVSVGEAARTCLPILPTAGLASTRAAPARSAWLARAPQPVRRGRAICGGTCSTLTSDENNCGACGNLCAPTENCIGGTCYAACASSDLLCATDRCGSRVSFSQCGACGTACQPGQVCNAGTCDIPSDCPVGYQVVDGVCDNFQSSALNCGAPGKACPAHTICQNGKCVSFAAGGVIEDCTGRSAISAATRTTAAPAAWPARAAQQCTQGTCLDNCGSFIQCGSGCVDLRTSFLNCGSCGVACVPGEACVEGACTEINLFIATMDGAYANCGTFYAAIKTDRTNCGACGVTCSFGPGLRKRRVHGDLPELRDDDVPAWATALT